MAELKKSAKITNKKDKHFPALETTKILNLVKNLQTLNTIVEAIVGWTNRDFESIGETIENFTKLSGTDPEYVLNNSEMTLDNLFFPEMRRLFQLLLVLFGGINNSTTDTLVMLRVSHFKDYVKMVVKNMLTFLYLITSYKNSLCSMYVKMQTLYRREVKDFYRKNYANIFINIDKDLDINLAPSSAAVKKTCKSVMSLAQLYDQTFSYLRSCLTSTKFQDTLKMGEALRNQMTKILNYKNKIQIKKDVPYFLLNDTQSQYDAVTINHFPSSLFKLATNQSSVVLSEPQRQFIHALTADEDCRNPNKAKGSGIVVSKNVGQYMFREGLGGTDLASMLEQMKKSIADMDDVARNKIDDQINKYDSKVLATNMHEFFDNIKQYLNMIDLNVEEWTNIPQDKFFNTIRKIYTDLNAVLDSLNYSAKEIQQQFSSAPEDLELEALANEIANIVNEDDSTKSMRKKDIDNLFTFRDNLHEGATLLIRASPLIKIVFEKLLDLFVVIDTTLQCISTLDSDITNLKIIKSSNLKFHLNAIRSFDFIITNFVPYEALGYSSNLIKDAEQNYFILREGFRNTPYYIQINSISVYTIDELLLQDANDSFFKSDKLKFKITEQAESVMMEMFKLLRAFEYQVRVTKTTQTPDNTKTIVIRKKHNQQKPTTPATTLNNLATEPEFRSLPSRFFSNEFEVTYSSNDINPVRNIECISSLIMATGTTYASNTPLVLLQNFLLNFELSVILALCAGHQDYQGLLNILDSYLIPTYTMDTSNNAVPKPLDISRLTELNYLRLLFFILILDHNRNVHRIVNDLYQIDIFNQALFTHLGKLVALKDFCVRLGDTKNIQVALDPAQGIFKIEVELDAYTVADCVKFKVKKEFAEDILKGVQPFPVLEDYLIEEDEETMLKVAENTVTYNNIDVLGRFVLLHRLKSKIYGSCVAYEYSNTAGKISLNRLVTSANKLLIYVYNRQ